MQVFVPYPDLKDSVCCLDKSRLGNQVYNEAYNLLIGNWPNHPANHMWRHTKPALAKYYLYGLDELARRNDISPYNYNKWYNYYSKFTQHPILYPGWWGDNRVHSSHRAALLNKNIQWYSQYGWTESPSFNYYWPPK